MKLPKSLRFKILNTITYLKNCSLGSDGITLFEKFQEEKPDLRHFRIVGSPAWIHIPKAKRKKLDEWSWQDIFVRLEGKNQYKRYNSHTGIVNVNREVKIDEKNFFNKSSLSR